MKKRKVFLFCTCITMAMSIAATACGRKETTVSQETINQVTAQPTETVSEEPVETAEVTETPAEEVVSTDVKNLSVLIASDGDNLWDEKNSVGLAEVVYPMIKLNQECAAEYPELQEALQTYSLQEKKKNLKAYKENVKLAKKDIAAIKKSNSDYYNKESVELKRSDTNVLSLLEMDEAYCGQNHPDYSYRSLNIDSQTGEALKITDVVKDMDEFQNLVKEELKTRWKKVKFFDKKLNMKKAFEMAGEQLCWTLDYNGVSVYFNPYELAPYCYGMQNVTISFQNHPELFVEKYMTVPEQYAFSLNFELPAFYDLDQDDELDEIMVSGKSGDYFDYSKQIISVNGQKYKYDIDAYEIDPVFVHMADGKNYLYVQNWMDNDYRRFMVYDMNGIGIKEVKKMDSGWHTFEDTEDHNYYTLQITDPSDFMLDTRTDLFSTADGFCIYRTGKDGVPITDNKEYTLNWKHTFTMKKTIDAEIIDQTTGEKKSDTTLEPGTKIVYYRTDNKGYGDFKLADGKIVRIYVTKKKWKTLVQGKPLHKVFKGTVFAG